MYFVSALRLS